MNWEGTNQNGWFFWQLVKACKTKFWSSPGLPKWAFISLGFSAEGTATLLAPSNSERVASPSPSNIGVKKSKVRVEQEKQTTKLLRLWQLTLQCCHHSDTISLSSSQTYSEFSTHPSSEALPLCSLSSSTKYSYPMLQKTNIYFTNHCIVANRNVNTTHRK